MKKNGAFTLIELLAVIAILGIIMIIAVPTVLNTIATAKKGAFKDSVLGIVKQIENNLMDSIVREDNNLLPLNGEYVLVDIKDKNISNIYDGYILITNNEGTYDYYPYITNGEYCVNGVLKTKISTPDILEKNKCNIKFTTGDIYIKDNVITNNTTDIVYKYVGLFSFSKNLNISQTFNYNYKGYPEIFTAPKSGYYRVELWGASGGSTNDKPNVKVINGGTGAYTRGDIYLNEGETIYVSVGGQGGNSKDGFTAGGYNGGGNGGTAEQKGSGGGGATDIRLSKTVYTSTSSPKLSYTSGGYLENGTIVLPPNGIQYGPYITLEKGIYQIIYEGENLDKTSTKSFYKNSSPQQYYETFNTNSSNNHLTYYINIASANNSLEFLFTNKSTENIKIKNITIYNLSDRIMVAGGGGGASNQNNIVSGGFAGGLTGDLGKLNIGAPFHTVATGGTQTSGGTAGTAGKNGGFFYGGNSESLYGGGAGGGYYGGGGGGTVFNSVSSGAGGSSFISGYFGANAIKGISDFTPSNTATHYSNKIFSNTIMLSGNEMIPNYTTGINQIGNNGNGYARISMLE